MTSSVTKEFRKRLDRPAIRVREQGGRAYALWRSNPFHPSLQFKQVSPRWPIYSVRVGIGFRALGLRETDHMCWFWIGSHTEYDELVRRL